MASAKDTNIKKIMVLSPPNISPKYSVSTPHEKTPLIVKPKKLSFWMMMWAVLLMLSSGFFLACCAAIIKWGSQLGFASMEMLMWRSGMQCVIAIISSILTCQAKSEWQQFMELTQTEYIYLMCRGLSGGIGVACYFHAITLIPVGDAITVLSIYPLIAAFLAYFILKERITIIHFFALIFAVIGVILISQPSFIFTKSNKDTTGLHGLLGYFISLSGGCIGGAVFIFIVKAKRAPTTALVCSQGIFCFLIALILCSLFQVFHILITWQDWICFLTLCIGGFLAQWTFNQGAKLVPAGLSSLLRSSDTIWSYVWQILWFHQMPNWITIIGAIGVISGVAMVSIEKIRAKRKAEMEKKQIEEFFNKSHTHLSMM